MSQQPKKYHGPELKCGGPGVCSDCTEKAESYRIRAPFDGPAENKIQNIIQEILDTHADTFKKLKDNGD